MNEEQVTKTVETLYDLDKDQSARDYISDLNNAFEPSAYRFATEASILEDVERYRIASAKFESVCNPCFTSYGYELRKNQKEPDLSEYWNRMARVQRNKIVKKILELLETGVARDDMQLNPPVSSLVAETARSLLQRKAPAHDDDREYFALCDKLFDYSYRVAVRDGYRALQY